MPSFSHLKMTSERSKRRGLLPCIFINKLNKAFLIATMFGEHSVSQEILLESFLAYLSNDERNLVKHALIDSLDSDQQDEWINFLDRFGCKQIPTQGECKDIIMEIAHKEQIQTSKYAIDCW